MNISNLFNHKKTIFSLEIFPPKKDTSYNTIYNTLLKLRGIPADFISVTYGGECLSLAAVVAALREYRKQPVHEHMWAMGQRLMDGYNDIATELGIHNITHCKGHPARGLIVFDDKGGQSLLMKSFVQQELIKRGILWSGFHNMCYSHTEADLDYTLAAYSEVLALFKAALQDDELESRLRGRPVQPVFRRTDSFNLKPAK